jgi:tetratricopeptide (TPR) repeat protein
MAVFKLGSIINKEYMRNYLIILLFQLLLIGCNNYSNKEIKLYPIITNHDSTARNKKIDSLKSLCINEFIQNKIDEAIATCCLIYKIDSMDVDNTSRLSVLYFIQGEHEQSLKKANEALKKDKSRNYTDNNLTLKALCFNELNMFDSASYYFKSLSNNTRNLVFGEIVDHYQRLNDTSNNNKYLQLGLKYYPNDPFLLYAKALTLSFTRKDYKSSIKIYNKLILNYSNKPELYLDRGFDYYNLNRTNEALTDFKMAEKLNPQIKFLNRYFLLAYLKLGEDDKAKKYYSKLIAENDTFYLRYKSRW